MRAIGSDRPRHREHRQGADRTLRLEPADPRGALPTPDGYDGVVDHVAPDRSRVEAVVRP